jgi:anti-sigma regulatory factor (Ser/Thr protein kinase)
MTLAAVPENVMLARQAVEGAALHYGAGQHLAADVKLAVSEACTNSVKHAYSEANRPGPMRLDLWAEADRIVVRASDDGQWRQTVPGPGDDTGLGLQLMTTLSTVCEVRQTEQGTEVSMEFDLKAGSDS